MAHAKLNGQIRTRFCLNSRLEESPYPRWRREFKYLGVCGNEGTWDWQGNWCSGSSNVVGLPVRCGKECSWAERKAFDFPVNLVSVPSLTWALGHDRKDKILNTSEQNEFSLHTFIDTVGQGCPSLVLEGRCPVLQTLAPTCLNSPARMFLESLH